MKKRLNQFNIVIVGTGGQGLITLLQILAKAALNEGCDVKTAELHGLSQRGGSIEVHIRFGENIFSPLVKQEGADLIISLEAQESLKACNFASKTAKTTFLVNNFFIPIPNQKSLKSEEIEKILKKFSEKVILIPASDICQKKLGTDVTAGIYLIGLTAFQKLIPLKPDSIKFGIKKIIPEKYLEMNLKTFNLAKKAMKTTFSYSPSLG